MKRRTGKEDKRLVPGLASCKSASLSSLTLLSPSTNRWYSRLKVSSPILYIDRENKEIKHKVKNISPYSLSLACKLLIFVVQLSSVFLLILILIDSIHTLSIYDKKGKDH